MMMVGFRWILILACGVIAWGSFVLPSFAAETSKANSSETLEEIDRQLENEPLSEKYLIAKAVILFKQKNYQAVIATVRPLLVKNPNCTLALEATAKSYSRLKDYGMAIDYMSRLIDLKPTYDNFFLRGSYRLRVGHFTKALEDNALCMRLHPSDGASYMQRAAIRYRQVGKLDELCENDLRKAIELSPRDPLVKQDFSYASKLLDEMKRSLRENNE